MPLMHCPGWWVLRQANHLGAEPGTQVYSMGRYDECPPKAGGVIIHTTWYISACLWSRSVSWWLAEISVELWEAVARRRLFVTMRYTNPRFTVVHLQWHVPVTLSAGTPVSGLEDRISTGWDGEHYLLEPHEIHNSWLLTCRNGHNTSLLFAFDVTDLTCTFSIRRL